MLFLEGAISENPWGSNTFTCIKALSHDVMVELVHNIGQRIARYLEKVGLVEGEYGQLVNTSGFSLHAGIFANANEPEKLERLCRCISRPAISEQRFSITDHGKVRYELKAPYRDGTNHVFFDPTDFIGTLAALIPPPRLNLIRFFGVFAPK
jgi:hypothetical protein